MEISDAYAIAVGGGFVLLFLVNSLPYVTGLAEYLTTQTSKHLTYPSVGYTRHQSGDLGRLVVSDNCLELSLLPILPILLAFMIQHIYMAYSKV